MFKLSTARIYSYLTNPNAFLWEFCGQSNGFSFIYSTEAYNSNPYLEKAFNFQNLVLKFEFLIFFKNDSKFSTLK